MPASFLIDGYNLIHALGLVRKQAGPGELEASRRRLLEFLEERFASVAADITVVFDAKRKPRHAPTEEVVGRIAVLYAPRNQEADDVIEGLIERHPAPMRLVVVSEDRRLRKAAARRQAHSMSSQQLLEHLERRAEPRSGSSAAAPEPMSPAEVEHWLREFQGVEIPNEYRDFLDPPAEKE